MIHCTTIHSLAQSKREGVCVFDSVNGIDDQFILPTVTLDERSRRDKKSHTVNVFFFHSSNLRMKGDDHFHDDCLTKQRFQGM